MVVIQGNAAAADAVADEETAPEAAADGSPSESSVSTMLGGFDKTENSVVCPSRDSLLRAPGIVVEEEDTACDEKVQSVPAPAAAEAVPTEAAHSLVSGGEAAPEQSGVPQGGKVLLLPIPPTPPLLTTRPLTQMETCGDAGSVTFVRCSSTSRFKPVV